VASRPSLDVLFIVLQLNLFVHGLHRYGFSRVVSVHFPMDIRYCARIVGFGGSLTCRVNSSIIQLSSRQARTRALMFVGYLERNHTGPTEGHLGELTEKGVKR
jgi:hypothetical protein